MTPQPFHLNVHAADLADLRGRLARTRWPDEPPLEPWSTGTSLAYMRDFTAYWHDRFDWRAQEARLNALPQFTLPIGGIDLHFIHIRGTGANPMPLLVSHGWPGSVFEFMRLIPLLSERFTLVIPSLPGYTLSFKPGQPRFSIEQVADLYAALMSALGYERFGAQGGDWGGFVASCLGHRHAARMIGIHLNLLAVDSRWQRRGLGRRLVQWLELSAITAGTFTLCLEVRARNPVAQLFYRELGFDEAGRVPRYYSSREDAIRLTKDLRHPLSPGWPALPPTEGSEDRGAGPTLSAADWVATHIRKQESRG